MRPFTIALLVFALILAGRAPLAAGADGIYVSGITMSELKKAIVEKKVALIDCSGTNSYRSAHIPGAIDFDSNEEHLAAVLPRDKKALVVSYCGGGSCSRYMKGAQAAMKLGYSNVKFFGMGIKGWVSAGERTEFIP